MVNSVYWCSDLTNFFVYDNNISPSYHFFSSFLFLACGEPPLCLSCSVLFAVKRAIENARSEIGKDELFVLCKCITFLPPPHNSCDLVFVTLAYNGHVQEYQLLLISVAGPATVEDIQQACLVDPSQFYF